MKNETSCITFVSHERDDSHAHLSPLRQHLIDFGRAADRYDGEYLCGMAQQLIDEIRIELSLKLKGKPDQDQARYFKEVIRTMERTAGDRLTLPTYESLAEGREDLVTSKELYRNASGSSY